jgi:hypothetical protein
MMGVMEANFSYNIVAFCGEVVEDLFLLIISVLIVSN